MGVFLPPQMTVPKNHKYVLESVSLFFVLIFVSNEKTKPKINKSKEENFVKTEEESILYGFKNKCENNYMNSQDDGIVTASYKRQKRKRKENSNMDDEARKKM